MHKRPHTAWTWTGILLTCTAPAWSADWTQFRGPGGQGIGTAENLPVRWSDTENIHWKFEMPGPGASSPILLGPHVFITAYSGYGLKANTEDQQKLMRHVLCLNRRSGERVWHKTFAPKLPEHNYRGEGSYHGYAGSTPTTDGKFLYLSFGKSGVFCLDLDGNQKWHADVGQRTNGWGSGCSPLLYGDLLIVNASVESGSLIALDKRTGQEIWKTGGISSSWNTPLLIGSTSHPEMVVSIQDHLLGLNPKTGMELWRAEGVHRYVCPSAVAQDGVVYLIGGGHTSLAVRGGGSGNVTKSHTAWRKTKGSNVSSPIYHDGHLYWASAGGGFLCCQNAATGETVYQQRLEPRPGNIWASPVMSDGKLYFTSQHQGTYVVAAGPKFELLAHNSFASDNSRTNASPAVSDGRLFLRTDRHIYCIAGP